MFPGAFWDPQVIFGGIQVIFLGYPGDFLEDLGDSWGYSGYFLGGSRRFFLCSQVILGSSQVYPDDFWGSQLIFFCVPQVVFGVPRPFFGVPRCPHSP